MQYTSVPYNQSHFIVRSHAYNRQFTVRPGGDSTVGFIGRKIVQPGSHIFVRADLHGDLRSLVENVKKLQELGLMSDDFTCAPNVQLVFLGDYMDRGPHTMQVLELLMTLRMQNPHHVTLIRGNHETIPMNMHPRMLPIGADENFKAFLTDGGSAQNKKLLDEIYQTMPLAYFIGEKNPEGVQYTMFTHGLFELYADPQEILTSSCEEDVIMHIQRAPTGAPDGVKSLFSDRVKALPYEEGKDYPLALR
ncbi:MAG: metallophosphoesterase, partial [Chlamydiae bacterium]|nr:metallophosphoesterase [Chlamydiota bacterium]